MRRSASRPRPVRAVTCRRAPFARADDSRPLPVTLHNLVQNRALEHCDVAVARPIRDRDTIYNRVQSNIFNWKVRKLTGEIFRDLGCSARALLVVRGIQIFAIALIGEIVIFTHAKDISHTGRPVPDTGSDCRARKRRLAGIPQRSAGFYAGSPTFQWVDQRPSMRNSRPDWYRAMRWRMAVASSRSPRRSAASTAR